MLGDFVEECQCHTSLNFFHDFFFPCKFSRLPYILYDTIDNVENWLLGVKSVWVSAVPYLLATEDAAVFCYYILIHKVLYSFFELSF